MHVDMLRVWQHQNGEGMYGMQWGDPDVLPPLRYLRETWVDPYVDETKTAVEIGPGGGRWTRYLLGFERVYLVEYHKELLDELRGNMNASNLVFVHNNGTDFPGVPPVDFVFSFGVFVHLDAPVIADYLANLRAILKPGGNAVLHYSDKTKPMAQRNSGFADMDPQRMRRLVRDSGYRILEEDTGTMWHSSLIRFTP